MPNTEPKTSKLRKKKDVTPVLLRMGNAFVDKLDALCETNSRSRRVVIEILVSEAYEELRADPNARIDPL